MFYKDSVPCKILIICLGYIDLINRNSVPTTIILDFNENHY